MVASNRLAKAVLQRGLIFGFAKWSESMMIQIRMPLRHSFGLRDVHPLKERTLFVGVGRVLVREGNLPFPQHWEFRNPGTGVNLWVAVPHSDLRLINHFLTEGVPLFENNSRRVLASRSNVLTALGSPYAKRQFE